MLRSVVRFVWSLGVLILMGAPPLAALRCENSAVAPANVLDGASPLSGGQVTPGFVLSQLGAPSVRVGSTSSWTVSSSIAAGFNAAVSLTVSGAPIGVAVTFPSGPIAAPGVGTTNMVVTASASAAPGEYSLVLNGSGGGTIASTSFSLYVVKVNAMASLTVGGAESQVGGAWDQGSIVISFNGFVEEVSYAQASTESSIAAHVAAAFTRDYKKFGLWAQAGTYSPTSAGRFGPGHTYTNSSIINFQLTDGRSFGPVSLTLPSTSFTLTPTGFGFSSPVAADSGTISLYIGSPGSSLTTSNGTLISSTRYTSGSEPQLLAKGLAANAASTLVTVQQDGDSILLNATQSGSGADYNFLLNLVHDTQDQGIFPNAPFQFSPSSGTLASGGGAATPAAVYSYGVSYDVASNVVALNNDTVMGSWAYTYDSLNRLSTAQSVANLPPYLSLNQNICWSYDAFGNRLEQIDATAPFTGVNGPCTPRTTGNIVAGNQVTVANNNQITGYVTEQGSGRVNSANITCPTGSTSTATTGDCYDSAGNVLQESPLQDQGDTFLYDAEERLCAAHTSQGYIGYQYDAAGIRVGKGTLTSFSCDLTKNGYTPTNDYVLDLAGDAMTELLVMGASQATRTWQWSHTNVMADGALIATYDTTGTGLHFYLNDPLGTRRMQTDRNGIVEQSWLSLPYGDMLQSTGNLPDPTEHHFTGKERDSESGLDYFGARYYASNMGRWMSPDWSEKVEAVPHAVLTNPQSLNLYQYGLNNPLSNVDPDGHDPQLEYLRRKAVRLAWNDERSMVQKTGTGTRPWTAAERAELLQTGRVSGYVGHHINSVNGSPDLAGEPNNIKFVEGVEGNLAEHGGNFGNPTTGELMNRSVVALQAIDMLVNAFGAAYQSNITGIDENFGGSISIADPAKAAVTLDGAFITTYGGFWKTTEGPSYSVRDGQYIDSQTHKAADPKTLKGKKFYFPPTA